MLAIRMQRTGRKGHAMFRIIVQDARRTPSSGKVVALIGNYDPHAKTINLDHEKTKFYLEHGAQPSPRVISILKTEKIKLPEWVEEKSQRQGAVRNPDKRRSTAPAQSKEPTADASTEEPVVTDTAATEQTTEKAPTEETTKPEE